MANNERVSQLVELFASELQTDDIVLATDTSQGESKKIELGQLLLYFESSGSFISNHALTASTASYVAASNIDGIVSVAVNATQSISASYADKTLSSSYAKTASFALVAATSYASITNADTASFLKYTGIPNGTSSYSSESFHTKYADTASFLQYFGGNNGTASYAITSSTSNSSSYATTSSYALNANVNSISPVKAWACVTWSINSSQYPELYQSYNIGNVKWLQTIDIAGDGSAGYWDLYGVTFTQPLLNINYSCLGHMIGTATSPYDLSVPMSPVMMMPSETRSINGFTMSINTGTGLLNTIAFGGHTTANFQILGL